MQHAVSGLWLVLEGHSKVAFVCRQGVTLARLFGGRFSLVRKLTGQQVRIICSTKVSDDRNRSSRCNALQAQGDSSSLCGQLATAMATDTTAIEQCSKATAINLDRLTPAKSSFAVSFGCDG